MLARWASNLTGNLDATVISRCREARRLPNGVTGGRATRRSLAAALSSKIIDHIDVILLINARIDLGLLAEEIERATTLAEVRAAAAEVRARLGASIVGNFAGSARLGRFGSRGLAIYFPSSKKAWDEDPDGAGYLESNSQFPVQFVTDHSWDDLLLWYHRKISLQAAP